MNKSYLSCPGCKSGMIKSYNGEAKLRAKLVKWNQDGMFAVCKSCGDDVPIKVDILKSLQSTFRYVIENEGCSGS